MTEKEACKILGLPLGASGETIKKRYRQLMLQTHPDGEAWERESYAYSASEINQAYAFLTWERSGGAGVRGGRGKGAGERDGGTAAGEKNRGGSSGRGAGDRGSSSRDGGERRSGGFRDGGERRGNSPRDERGHWSAWDAPLNENAFCEREVLHNVEDEDGTVLGNFCVASGKYLWTVQEDFSLFLQSVYRSCQSLLDGIDAKRRREALPGERQKVLSELFYLMVQQFIDATALLGQMAKEKTGAEKTGTEKTRTEKNGTDKAGTEKTGAEKNGTDKAGAEKTAAEKTNAEKPQEAGKTAERDAKKNRTRAVPPDEKGSAGNVSGASDEKEDPDRIFYLPAMLECRAGTPVLQTGEMLYPSGIRRHRLYLKNRTGQELGYLSFGDDRLYYVVIPLFEQQRVRVRIRAAGQMENRRSRAARTGAGAGRYQRLHLWLKLAERQDGGMPENLNLQIERLLEDYRRCGQGN